MAADLNEFQKLLGRHALALAVLLEDGQDPAAPRTLPLFFSGFVMAVGSNLVWVSAGHVVSDIKGAMSKHGYSLRRGRFSDYGLYQSFAFPTAVSIDRFDYVDLHAEFGPDFALYDLGTLDRMNLEQGGVLPIGPERVAPMASSSPHYLAVGFPSEWTSFSADREGVVTALTIQPLSRLTDDGRHKVPRLSFEAHTDLVSCAGRRLKNINGLSGSPIFALDMNSPDSYKLIAVQSTWLASSRTAFACPADFLLSYLSKR